MLQITCIVPPGVQTYCNAINKEAEEFRWSKNEKRAGTVLPPKNWQPTSYFPRFTRAGFLLGSHCLVWMLAAFLGRDFSLMDRLATAANPVQVISTMNLSWWCFLKVPRKITQIRSRSLENPRRSIRKSNTAPSQAKRSCLKYSVCGSVFYSSCYHFLDSVSELWMGLWY